MVIAIYYVGFKNQENLLKYYIFMLILEKYNREISMGRHFEIHFVLKRIKTIVNYNLTDFPLSFVYPLPCPETQIFVTLSSYLR